MNDHEKHWDMKHRQNGLMHVLHRSVEPTLKLHIHATYGDPKELKRDVILYKHLFFRASLSEDGDQAG